MIRRAECMPICLQLSPQLFLNLLALFRAAPAMCSAKDLTPF